MKPRIAFFRSAFLMVLLTACRPFQPSEPPTYEKTDIMAEGLLFSASGTVQSDTLVVSVTATNQQEVPLKIDWPGGCEVRVNLFRDGAVAWSSMAAAKQEGYTIGCNANLVFLNFAPGETQSFSTHWPVRLILADSLKPGMFGAEAIVRPNLSRVYVPAGGVNIQH